MPYRVDVAVTIDTEAVAKRAAFATLVAYLLGLLVTALYLYQQDVPLPDPAAFKPRFIYTGAIVIVALIVGGYVPYLAWAVSRPSRRPDPSSPASSKTLPSVSFAKMIAMFVCYGFFEWIGYTVLLQRNQAYTDANSALTAIWLTLLATAIGLLVFGTFHVVPRTDELLLVSVAAAVGAGLLLWYLVLFSGSILPQVPDQYGGTEPKRAVLVFNQEGAQAAKALGITVKGSRSSPVAIIYQGDTFLALRLDGGAIVQVQRDTVSGAVMDSKAPFAQDIQTRDEGGHPGTGEPGDRLLLTFSEALDPASILSGWDGGRVGIALQGVATEGGGVKVSVWDSKRQRRVALGFVDFRFGVAGSVSRPAWANGSMVQRGATIELTLAEPVALGPPGAGAILFWTPSDAAMDPSGNHTIARTVQEKGDDNPDPRPEF